MVLLPHGILVKFSLCADDQRTYYVKMPGAHGISHHERPCLTCHLCSWKQTRRSHVDKLGVFGVCKASVRGKLTHASESFDKRGLKSQEQEVQSGIVTCPGPVHPEKLLHQRASVEQRT